MIFYPHHAIVMALTFRQYYSLSVNKSIADIAPIYIHAHNARTHTHKYTHKDIKITPTYDSKIIKN